MEIKSSKEAANVVANVLRETGVEYCQFELGRIGGVLPVSGSAVRDGSIANATKQALGAWARFLDNRSAAAVQMGQLMADADNKAANSLR